MNPADLTNPDIAGPRALRDAFGTFPSGVVVLAAKGPDGHPAGMACSSFTSVSLDPPMAHVCIDAKSSTREPLFAAERIGVSVLSHHQLTLCRQMSRKGVDRFNGVEWIESSGGAILLEGAASWFECTRSHEVQMGDHFVEVLSIDGVRSFPEQAPLVFHASEFKRLHDA